jgi:hypothetical protein
MPRNDAKNLLHLIEDKKNFQRSGSIKHRRTIEDVALLFYFSMGLLREVLPWHSLRIYSWTNLSGTAQ